jgi:hypothetical protein
MLVLVLVPPLLPTVAVYIGTLLFWATALMAFILSMMQWCIYLILGLLGLLVDEPSSDPVHWVTAVYWQTHVVLTSRIV